MSAHEWLIAALLVLGCGFYLRGTVGMLRFTDAMCRLHPLTKADTVGRLLVCTEMTLQSRSLRVALLLGIVWLLSLLAATVWASLIARRTLNDRVRA